MDKKQSPSNGESHVHRGVQSHNRCKRSSDHAYPEQAHETAKYLGIDVLETTAYDFANGEMVSGVMASSTKLNL